MRRPEPAAGVGRAARLAPALAAAALLVTALPPAARAAATRDTSVRVPGTSLRFGAALDRVVRTVRREGSLGTAGRPPVRDASGLITWETRLRFFGVEGDAKLHF